ncbi:benzoate 4-monooxygenase cytochrome P450 [Trichodelitschia bisporula]|uniref:Benzoate 4-monooxygenase cytochrome P450 n=1 Tax=Trichodelitschia bisporula TaxID=703511 RepID=A0A6G1HSH9_9PEZI|nr:benzoate 4-monooxygenase cytochrome P450 [Trichodelitschia bisporula]
MVLLGDQQSQLMSASNVSRVAILYPFAAVIYNLFFHPLRKFPGPRLAAATKLAKSYYLARGETVDWISKLHDKYGPVVRVAPSELSFIEAQGWKDIYGFQSAGRPTNRKDPVFYAVASFETTNLLNANDADHARTRRIFSHAFSDKALKAQEPLLRKYVDLMVEKLYERAAKGKIDMVEMLNFTTFDIMSDLSFGEPLYMLENSEYVPWVALILGSLKGAAMVQVVSYLPLISGIVGFLFNKLINRMRRVHFKFCVDRVDRRLAAKTDRADIWTYVLRQENEKGLSLGEMHSNADLFMIAGTETTASLLSGLIFHLLTNPESLKELTKEIRSAFSSPEEMNLSSLVRLKYLHACLEEGLRMYTPVPAGVPRLTPPEGAAICGRWIPGNTAVYVTPFTSFRSVINFRNPEEFIPERWISSDYDSDNKAALQPFSVGPRNCIGKNLAYHEMRLILAMLLYHFDLRLSDESKSWNNQKVYALWAKPPLMVMVGPRKR